MTIEQVHQCHCGFDEIDHTVSLDEAVQEAIKAQVADSVQWATAAYQNTFSVLTIHFAEGSVPAAVTIPYQPFQNRTDIHLPIRVAHESHGESHATAGIVASEGE